MKHSNTMHIIRMLQRRFSVLGARFAVLGAWLVVLALAGCTTGATPLAEPQTRLSAVAATSGDASQGFAKATQPRTFVFPQDHGPHQEYATEWWYYTGNLDTADGRHFGYQLTFFRFGLAPAAPQRTSDFGTANIYMAHLAVSDVASGTFYAFDRFSRGAAGLAGATGTPTFRVWLEDWSAASAGDGLPMRVQAAQGDVALDLTLETARPVVLQGERGLSQKSATPGNASYYYSFTRMETTGALTVAGQRQAVRGLSWFDREWGTSALEAGSVGWDWLAVQLDDGRDLMYAQVRRADGSAGYAFGTLVAADGSAQRLAPADVTLETLATWRSPRSGTQYPAQWRLRVPSAQLDLRLTPYLADQELLLAVRYWEGAVKVEGTAGGQPVRGNAYVELTGYAEQDKDAVRVR